MRLLALFLLLTSVFADDASRLVSVSIREPEGRVRGEINPNIRPLSLRKRFLQDTPVMASRPSTDTDGGGTGGGGEGAGESNNDGGDDADDEDDGNDEEGNGGRKYRDRSNGGGILERPAPTTLRPTRRPTRAPTISPTVSYQERQEKPENQGIGFVGGTLFISTKPPIDEPVRTTPVPTIRPTGPVFTISKFPAPTEPGPTAKPTTMPIPDLSLLLPAPTSAPVALPPTENPSDEPTTTPTGMPNEAPTTSPTTISPSRAPTAGSTTLNPSESPTVPPSTLSPSLVPTKVPSTAFPSTVPSIAETTANIPSDFPSKAPVVSSEPTEAPSVSPTTEEPTKAPSLSPTTEHPTEAPSLSLTSEEPTQSKLPDLGAVFPAVEIDPSRFVPQLETVAPTSDAPSSNPSEAISKTRAPTLAPTTTTSAQDTTYSYSELQQLQGASELSTISLEFSIWFPHHRVSNLNVTRVENDVLSSLEALFCDIHSPAVNIIETSNTVCVLEDELVLDQDSNPASPRARQQVTPIPHITDVTILRAPYVTHLDERYAFEAGVHFSWTTWKVQWEVLQVGVPVLEKAIHQLEPRSSALTAEEAYEAGIREVQKQMRKAMTDSIRTGDFDIILQSTLHSVTALSSPVGNELDTFDFSRETGAEHSQTVDQAAENESGSDANRNKTIVFATIGVAFCVAIALGAYFSLKPRSPRNLWKREREQHILDAIEEEACKEHHLNCTREHALRSSGTTEDQRGSTDAVEPTLGIESSESVPIPSVYMRNVDDISEPPEDQVSSLESIDIQWSVETWSVDGVDAEWKPWPSTNRDDSFGDIAA